MKRKPLLRCGTDGAQTLAADCIAETLVYSPLCQRDSMKYSAAETKEARRLAHLAQGQVTVQIEMFDRMRRSGFPPSLKKRFG
jgi:hypothetical protein